MTVKLCFAAWSRETVQRWGILFPSAGTQVIGVGVVSVGGWMGGWVYVLYEPKITMWLSLSLSVSLSLSLFNRPFSRWTWVSRCLLKQRIMEVVVTGDISRATIQSNHHHQQSNTQLFTGRMPFLSPNQQCQIKVLKGLAYPKLTWGLSTLSLTTNSLLHWGRVACLSSALWCQYPKITMWLWNIMWLNSSREMDC